MSRGQFLDNPARFTRTPRESITPARYGDPWEHVVRPMDWQDKVVIAASAIAAIACLTLFFVPL